MPLSELTEPLGRKRAAHLLRRACFGASKSEIDEFSALTPSEAVSRLFQEGLPDPEPPIDPATGSEWVFSGTVEDVNSDDRALTSFFTDWHLALMTGYKAPATQRLASVFRERLVYFLHTHFTTKKTVVGDSRALYFQNSLFRKFAFDKEDIIIPGDPENDIPDRTVGKNFKTLTKKVSLDNAMLAFLDGDLNVKGRPNENYARELLELYSIGRGLEGATDKSGLPDGDYLFFTEQDVIAGARVLSGFDVDETFSNIDEDTGLPTGILKGGGRQHDEDPKQFSVRFSNRIIEPDPELLVGGRSTFESISDEIDQLLDMIFSQPETARHISRKLYRFFVYHEIPTEVQETTIQEMADILSANDFKIQPVLEALFSSQVFYEGQAGVEDDFTGSLIKSPIDLVIGTLRSFEYNRLPDYLNQAQLFYDEMREFRNAIRLMGLDYYEPFEVAGYSAYHQFPIFNRAWISTNYLTNRYNFIRNLINEANAFEPLKVNVLEYILANFPEQTYIDGRELTRVVVSYFLPLTDNLAYTENSSGELTDERLNFFLQEFLYKQSGIGETGEEAWTKNFTGENYNPSFASERLSFLFNAILQTPEYQLM